MRRGGNLGNYELKEVTGAQVALSEYSDHLAACRYRQVGRWWQVINGQVDRWGRMKGGQYPGPAKR